MTRQGFGTAACDLEKLIRVYELCDVIARETFLDTVVAMHIPFYCKLPIIAKPVYIGYMIVLLLY
jgi:hypothetical protein